MSVGFTCREDSSYFFAVIITEKEEDNVIADIYHIDENAFCISDALKRGKYQNDTPIENDDIINFGNHFVQLDIWRKYYFTKFSNSERQWYHKDTKEDVCYMEMIGRLMKYAYNKAIKLIETV